MRALSNDGYGGLPPVHVQSGEDVSCLDWVGRWVGRWVGGFIEEEDGAVGGASSNDCYGRLSSVDVESGEVSRAWTGLRWVGGWVDEDGMKRVKGDQHRLNPPTHPPLRTGGGRNEVVRVPEFALEGRAHPPGEGRKALGGPPLPHGEGATHPSSSLSSCARVAAAAAAPPGHEEHVGAGEAVLHPLLLLRSSRRRRRREGGGSRASSSSLLLLLFFPLLMLPVGGGGGGEGVEGGRGVPPVLVVTHGCCLVCGMDGMVRCSKTEARRLSRQNVPGAAVLSLGAWPQLLAAFLFALSVCVCWGV